MDLLCMTDAGSLELAGATFLLSMQRLKFGIAFSTSHNLHLQGVGLL